MNTILFILLIVLIVMFALTNGFLDGGGLVSTVIATRTLTPFTALMLVAVCEIIGLLLLGHAVTKTLGVHLISYPIAAGTPQILGALVAAVGGALGWNLLMWGLAFPSSSSHALLGGLIGSTWIFFGLSAIHPELVIRIFVGLIAAPFVALLLAFCLSRFFYWIGEYMTPGVAPIVRGAQIVALAGVALTHGSNDGQKSLALILMALAAWRNVSGADQVIPLWAELLCGGLLAIGIVLGSRRTIETMSTKLCRIQNLEGLSASTSTMGLVGISSLIGLPMSSSHVMASSVLGAGSAVNPKAVRWNTAGGMVLAWLVTVPASAAVAAGVGYVVSKTI